MSVDGSINPDRATQLHSVSASTSGSDVESDNMNAIKMGTNDKVQFNASGTPVNGSTDSSDDDNGVVEAVATAISVSNKRRAGSGSGHSCKKAKTADGFMGTTCSWDDLILQLRAKLRCMDSDECFLKSIQLSTIGRLEVERRSKHLSQAFDIISGGRQQPSPQLSNMGASDMPWIKMQMNPMAVQANSAAMLPQYHTLESICSLTTADWMEKYQELCNFQVSRCQ